MNPILKSLYPALVALALTLAVLLDNGALFIVMMAAAIAGLPLAYASDVDEIARRSRERAAAAPAEPWH